MQLTQKKQKYNYRSTCAGELKSQWKSPQSFVSKEVIIRCLNSVTTGLRWTTASHKHWNSQHFQSEQGLNDTWDSRYDMWLNSGLFPVFFGGKNLVFLLLQCLGIVGLYFVTFASFAFKSGCDTSLVSDQRLANAQYSIQYIKMNKAKCSNDLFEQQIASMT